MASPRSWRRPDSGGSGSQEYCRNRCHDRPSAAAVPLGPLTVLAGTFVVVGLGFLALATCQILSSCRRQSSTDWLPCLVCGSSWGVASVCMASVLGRRVQSPFTEARLAITFGAPTETQTHRYSQSLSGLTGRQRMGADMTLSSTVRPTSDHTCDHNDDISFGYRVGGSSNSSTLGSLRTM